MFLADTRPQILKMRQERFPRKEFVFRALPPPTISKDSASAEGASEEKLAILREILRQIYPKMQL